MKRWSVLGVLAGASIAACITIPEFRGNSFTDAGMDIGIDGPVCPNQPDYTGNNGSASLAFVSDNGGGTVSNTNYLIHFASGNAFHFPDIVQLGGANVLANVSTICNTEEQVGIALHPGASINATSSLATQGGQLVTTQGWNGPAVVQLNVHWQADYPCMRQPGGFSLFTMFPDGRIHRHDRVDDSGTPVDWADCQCSSGGGGFFPTTFWTFEQEHFTSLETAEGTSFLLPATGIGSNNAFNPGAAACLQGSNGSANSVSIAWPGMMPRVRVPTPSLSAAFVFDFTNQNQGTGIPAFSYATATTLLLGTMNCTEPTVGGLARATSTLAVETLLVNGMVADRGTYDGIFAGADDASGMGGVAINGGTATITTTDGVSAGFAIWIRFAEPTCDITIAKTPIPGGNYYVKQRVSDRDWVIWFSDAMNVGTDTITINAL